MVEELAPRLEGQAPLLEAPRAGCRVQPFERAHGCEREPADMEESLLDGDHVLTVAAELRDYVGDFLVQPQEAVFEEGPHGRGHDRLGRGEDRVQSLLAGRRLVPIVGDGSEHPEAGQPPFSGNRNGCARESPVLHIPLDSLEEGVQPVRVDSHVLWPGGHLIGKAHVTSPVAFAAL